MTDGGIPMKTTLVIACGALAHEIVAVFRANQWHHVDIQCLPAEWHNTPEKITPAIEEKLRKYKTDYQRILVAYGDCGTGGRLDSLLAREGVERLPGPHCYSFFSDASVFDQLADDTLGTFYLTDYLAANFNRLILEDLGIADRPQLLDMYFGHYTKLLYLSQQPTDALTEKARAAADALGLEFEIHHTGLEPLTKSFKHIAIASE